jgi:TRAP-type C4-dicarboxylate transport system substrate-binding protein
LEQKEAVSDFYLTISTERFAALSRRQQNIVGQMYNETQEAAVAILSIY